MLTRKKFFKQKIHVALPDLLELQTSSYQWLFKEGIRELLDEISPVSDFTGKLYELEFNDYALEEPKYDEETAKDKNLTYKAPLRCHVVLKNKFTKQNKESDVFFGDFPLMTNKGTFIINGIERVVVSQIVRSFGVLFVSDEIEGRKLFGAKIIPSRGAWLELETSNKDAIYVKIDRKRKIPITTFLRALGMTEAEIMAAFKDVNDNPDHDYVKATFEKDTVKDHDQSLVEVYKRIRPGDLATAETAQGFIEALFHNPKRYDLGKVGRYKLNQRLGIQVPNTVSNRILRLPDVIEVIAEIIRLNNDPNAQPDDIDNLKNRRIRAVGELVQSRLRVGFLRMERIIKDRMSVIEPEAITPAQLVNSRPITAILQEFFASSQLSQFMNQTNPLSEIEHERCLSATGPGGLSRERAGFEVRDVHSSHYGRICPIETPEGPNIGLVGYLATYGKINEFGFIETPYLVVEHKAGKARVTSKVVYLDAAAEEKAIIAPSSAKVGDDGYFPEAKIIVRKASHPTIDKVENIQYMDVSPKQTVSLATALIPFVEHDDATRTSMGSNMERQAVPLVRPKAALVGTGMESELAKYSGRTITAEQDGTVAYVSSTQIRVKEKNQRKDTIYNLKKFVRSNQATCITQRPIVKTGERIKKSQVIADSYATDGGELALGRDVLCAFMSFEGGNFEDAIIISERLLKEDYYTSIHIEKYAVEVRDTKLGPELLTRDIPNVGEEALANLDGEGIIIVGAEVTAGAILVGKITPKGETELTAEEKLLRAIFGEKAKEVKDSSLRLPHGERGKIVAVKIFRKDLGDELATGVYEMVEVLVAQLRKVSVGDKLAGRHGNKGVISKILPEEEMPYLPDGTPVDVVLNPLGVISRMNLGQILETHLGWAAKNLGYYVENPVFEGVDFTTIQDELEKAGLPRDGKIQLYDGKTGELFDQKTTVGYINLMKLCHMVDDKMHARSTGPYSMITQQPLGGKAQFGGQRFGEMEVWALEAYGAAHTLQEMLTIKSDDVIGRSKAYEAIIKGEAIQKPSTPASFNVLIKELQGLGLSVCMLGGKSGVRWHRNKTTIKMPAKATLPKSQPKEPLEEKLTQRVDTIKPFEIKKAAIAKERKTQRAGSK